MQHYNQLRQLPHHRHRHDQHYKHDHRHSRYHHRHQYHQNECGGEEIVTF